MSVDCVQTNSLLKLLDTVVVKLEGGTEEDLQLIEQEYAGEYFLNYALSAIKNAPMH